MSTRHAQTVWAALAMAAGVLALPGASHAATIKSDDKAELVFVLWDPVAKVSYTRDLGIVANDFWVYAQQDKGYTGFDYKLDATDPALVEFRKASTVLANQQWAVFGFDAGPTLTPGDTKIFSTLTQGPSGGVVNPNWTDMTTAFSGQLMYTAREIGSRLYFGLNFNGTDATQYVRPNGAQFTSFDKQASAGYFAGNTGFSGPGSVGQGGYLGGVYSVVNKVNTSSWFYYITNVAGSDAVVVDEFDNLSSNGYWGLALGSDNLYRLSFTQAAATTPSSSATSALGASRVAGTDFTAEAGPARLVFDAAAVSAVPEPTSALLLGLGLAGLAAWRRRSASA